MSYAAARRHLLVGTMQMGPPTDVTRSGVATKNRRCAAQQPRRAGGRREKCPGGARLHRTAALSRLTGYIFGRGGAAGRILQSSR
jgi:hypothetical protein